ncbi:PLP-dependent aminotransferase family protein [Nonomuraea sp. KC401]|uniref:MocR-like pyridoxine biosynthesis transcription factor PdxR n=1 Tax=unclassified Nonomuraea TaxID=2593643 RepID=UPI0010FE08BB|nr:MULTISPECIES: PLP-dependent aminotransferase family protein [unclassified Nonomuraea]NBE98210.1 aminotransferase class I/II-fold pyridoxal phosphate-dependent enzyme [Nonomuraea sp. K271]TLF85209.1 PLP-dependent aminotransferase family protein [Nonomuraea sp. KC401]
MADLHIQLDRDQGAIAGQIGSELRDAIRSGRLAAGTRLPATRDLAADLQVSRGVVVEAYEQLVAEGFLVSRVGVGTQVTPVPAAGAAPRQRAAPPARPASDTPAPYYGHRPTSPDLSHFPRERWLAAVRHVLATVPSDALDYGDPGGVPELREELAGYLRRVRAADARPENLIIVGGVAQGLSLVLHVLSRQRPLRLAVEDPTSHRQAPLLRRAGARLVPVPVDEEGLDVRRLSGDAVLVTPAHQFPTGVVLSPSRRAALMEWAHAGDRVILEDDYDAEFRFDRDPVGCLQGLAPDRVVLSGSVSKALAPGLRLGWVAAPPDLAEDVRRARGELDLGSPVIEQYALAHFLRTGGYDKHLRRMRREYRRRRDALVRALAAELPEISVKGIDAGLHVYLELPGGWDEPRTARVARELGLAAEPVGPMRETPGEPAVAVGFARLPVHKAAEAVRGLKVRMSGHAMD